MSCACGVTSIITQSTNNYPAMFVGLFIIGYEVIGV